MLLGLKKQFHPFVLEGSKTHTIRAKRKNAPRVGQSCDLYGDVRQKTMFLLGRWKCVKVEDIVIDASSGIEVRVLIDGLGLSKDEKDSLAHRDGFRYGGFREMLDFWRPRLEKDPVWRGDIIHWAYDPDGRAVQFGGKAR